MTDLSSVLDTSALSQLIELDEEGSVLVEVVETFLKDAPKHIAAMQQAISNNDAKLLDRSAHTLKSTAAAVGAVMLASICKEVEHIGRQGQVDPAKSSLPKVEEELKSAEAALALELAKWKRA